MDLKFLRWLIPIVMELFKSNSRYQNYFKRNKTISLLAIACVVAILLALFMSEQAVMHGYNSKHFKSTTTELTEKLTSCGTENEKLSAKCAE